MSYSGKPFASLSFIDALLKLKADFIYAFIIVCVFLLLLIIVRSLKHSFSKFKPIPKDDEFLQSNGYTYDFVLIFAVINDSDKSDLSDYQLMYSMKNIIDRLEKASIESKIFFSCQRDEIYVKIRASSNRLEAEAIRISYKLLLDEDKLRNKAHNGKAGIYDSISITDEFHQSELRPYQYIYGPFIGNSELRNVYSLYDVRNDKKHLFKGSDRLKLLTSILEGKTNNTPPGCGLNLRDLLMNHAVLAAFPLHDYDELAELTRTWIKLISVSSETDVLDKVRDYFGERIGLYFVFIQHYVSSLVKPAAIGLCAHMILVIYNSDASIFNVYFAAYMIYWSSMFSAEWEHKQISKAMEWGVVGFEDEETDRPQFVGELITSPVDGTDYYYYPDNQRIVNSVVVAVVIITSLIIVCTFVGSIAVFQWWLDKPKQLVSLSYRYVDMTTVIAAFVSACIISLLSFLFNSVAFALADYENHRTDTEYEDNLVQKIFVFQCFNANAPIIYVAFIKSFSGLICIRNSCITDTGTTLVTITLTHLIARFTIEVLVKKLRQVRNKIQESSGLPPDRKMGPIEKQYILSEFDVLFGTMNDFSSLMLQFNYACLYVVAFPLAPFLALVSAYTQMRVDAWKLCMLHRRPLPKCAEDIGVWASCIDIIGTSAVVVNIGLIFFTGRFFSEYTWNNRWTYFVCAEICSCCLKFLVYSATDEIPHDVAMQLKRQSFLIDKIIRNNPDDDIYDDNAPVSMNRRANTLDIAIDDNDDWLQDLKVEDDTTLNGSIQVEVSKSL